MNLIIPQKGELSLLSKIIIVLPTLKILFKRGLYFGGVNISVCLYLESSSLYVYGRKFLKGNKNRIKK